MKLVWSPETAADAFVSTVKSCEISNDSGVAELVSAMAAGWNAKLIVETWSPGGPIATSVGLAIAKQHAGGRHVCVVPDEETRKSYLSGLKKHGVCSEVVVGEPGKVMPELVGVDFLVVDSRRKDFSAALRLANLSNNGAVLIIKNANPVRFSSSTWRAVAEERSRRLVRSVFLPVGKGLDIAHVSGSATVRSA